MTRKVRTTTSINTKYNPVITAMLKQEVREHYTNNICPPTGALIDIGMQYPR
jgi:hypothetical protein